MSFAKQLIGVNADFRSARDASPAYSVIAAGYYDAIQKAGGIPVIVPPIAEADVAACK